MTDQEINEAVARKLGFVPWNDYVSGKEGYSSGEGWYRSSPGRVLDLPNYCHSIEAAWEIVELLQKTHWTCLDADNGEYRFSYGKYKNKTWVERSDDTAPMAICLAFLKLEDK